MKEQAQDSGVQAYNVQPSLTEYTSRTVAAAGMLMTPSVGYSGEIPTVISSPSVSHEQKIDAMPSQTALDSYDIYVNQQLNTQSANEQLSNILSDEEIRWVLATALGLTATATVGTYFHSKKYDEKMLQALRTGAPALATAGTAALLYDSVNTIDRHIPASLLMGAAFLQAGANLINIYERESDPKIKLTTSATAGFFVAIGIASFVAIDKI